MNDYQRQAMRTSNKDLSERDRLFCASLGLGGETGELLNLIRKEVLQGRPRDVLKIKEELGDCLWYIAEIAELYGLKLEEVAAHNLKKLQMRYQTRK